MTKISSLEYLSPGDHIQVPGEKFKKNKFYAHHLLVVQVKSNSEVIVIHNLNKRGVVEEIESMKPEDVKVLIYPCKFKAEEAIKRARSKVGSFKYKLLSNNCEHFVTWAKTGESISLQVIRAVRTSVGAAAGAGGTGAVGVAAGVAIGAAAGSFVPIVGTIAGGILGGIIGGVGSAVVGVGIGGIVGNKTSKCYK